MTVGSLCAGIGGFDLGFERAGMTVRWQVEIDPFCRKVLAKHWPNVKRYEDLTTLTGDELEPVDLVCAGFPCQPVSVAGAKKGQADERWIWPHIARLLGVLRPRWVVLENTPGLFTANSGHAFGEVIGDLAALRFDAEWEVLSAADVGAPHLRKRVWIVADANRDRRHAIHRGGLVSDEKRKHTSSITRRTNEQPWFDCNGEVADTDGAGCEKRRGAESVGAEQRSVKRGGVARRIFHGEIGGEWESEPELGRVADGVRNRVDRLKGLGNAIVPQIAEWIGRRIIEVER